MRRMFTVSARQTMCILIVAAQWLAVVSNALDALPYHIPETRKQRCYFSCLMRHYQVVRLVAAGGAGKCASAILRKLLVEPRYTRITTLLVRGFKLPGPPP